jgi:hypothetical protein
MSEPVYLLVLGYNYTEAWHELSKAEQDALWVQVDAIDRRAGAKAHIFCNARWADESIFTWGVMEYPSIEAYQQKVAELEQMQWWRYVVTKTILGTKMVE